MKKYQDELSFFYLNLKVKAFNLKKKTNILCHLNYLFI